MRFIGTSKRGKHTLSPKFNKPTARPPRTTVKCNHDKNVRSLAKETLGSIFTGSAIRFAAVLWRRGWVDMMGLMVGRRREGKMDGWHKKRCAEGGMGMGGVELRTMSVRVRWDIERIN